ncbi:hypothetical protein CYMTET_24677 [Cymbomonas tetramitiformis]|uniref:Uncharacterized protein n=2 Tax=Cymbomonas tetramitiformis TaxID=36881 RepID=A0AAE0KZP4_9CHLO|nr:hypothetical protein CYMTET_24677 [Cymbomonas tetramitiformis]
MSVSMSYDPDASLSTAFHEVHTRRVLYSERQKSDMRRATSLPTSVYPSAASQTLLEAFPHLRVARPEQSATFETTKIHLAEPAPVGSSIATHFMAAPVTPASSRLELFDILSVEDIGLLILSKFLTAEHRAALACTCALGKEMVTAEFFRENLLFADCLKLTDEALRNLILRATLDAKEGVTLATLDISGCKQLSWRAVRSALPDMGQLGRLCMLGGPLVEVASSAETYELLAELEACTAAASFSLLLHIDGERLYDGGDRDATRLLLAILYSLSTPNPNLKIEALDLTLQAFEVGPEAAKALAATLNLNEQGVLIGSIQLDLTGNSIKDEGAKALAVALTPNAQGVLNTSLKTLDLGCNGIGSEGAKALAVALTPNVDGVFNTSLITLNLENNELCDVDEDGDGMYDASGIKALADALAFSKSLNTLNFAGNTLCGVTACGDGTYNATGIKALADALAFNGSLKKLLLEGNEIGPEGAKALARALTPNAEGLFNRSLSMLDLTRKSPHAIIVPLA